MRKPAPQELRARPIPPPLAPVTIYVHCACHAVPEGAPKRNRSTGRRLAVRVESSFAASGSEAENIERSPPFHRTRPVRARPAYAPSVAAWDGELAGVADVLALDHEDHHLGPVGPVVADPLDVLDARLPARAEIG